ncbi:hypothetical protein RhiirA5_426214 [Rhizophagus irregularis]|uniref:Uncharacterized protein n=1 Tax=Rhizophagus irregularis TaxID=588596 RepID=A0A2N0P4J2_9GLOM|nr:hypothetical protein RhiirA5_426214 [Rhizophagus irregularis]GET61542.1 hypothetical protein GLOIN_2v1787970 [Rhizophagus irregularis DAOM 181602=DAOM 197198]
MQFKAIQYYFQLLRKRYQKLMPKFIGKKCEIQVNFELKDGEYLYILVTHDKTTFQLNDK